MFRLEEGIDFGRAHSLYRILDGEIQEEVAQTVKSSNQTQLISKQTLVDVMKIRGGTQFSRFLTDPNEFGNRLIAACIMAGNACIDRVPQRSFLFFAVCLESLILGRRTGEITYQLAIRMAHLLSSTPEGRKSVFQQTKKLYETRSRIAHEGQGNIAARELSEIWHYCMASILALATLPDFAGYTDSKQLEKWFEDRILGVSMHST